MDLRSEMPLVWGWLVITTQYGRGRRTNRLLENRAAQLHTIDLGGHVVQVRPQTVLRVGEVAGEIHNDNSALVYGDEQRLGPFYNYAQLATWSYLAKKIVLT
jgi:hypothetical protein